MTEPSRTFPSQPLPHCDEKSLLEIPTSEILRREAVQSINRFFDHLIIRAQVTSKPENNQLLIETLHIFCSDSPENRRSIARLLPEIIPLVPGDRKWLFKDLLFKLAETADIKKYLPAIALSPKLHGILDKELCKASKTTVKAIKIVAKKRHAAPALTP